MHLPESQRGAAKTDALPARRTIEIRPVAALPKAVWIRVRGARTHCPPDGIRTRRLRSTGPSSYHADRQALAAGAV